MNLPKTITTVNTNSSFEVNCGISGYPTAEVQLSGVDTPLKYTKHPLTMDLYCKSAASVTITWDPNSTLDERKAANGRSIYCRGSDSVYETFSLNVQCMQTNIYQVVISGIIEHSSYGIFILTV